MERRRLFSNTGFTTRRKLFSSEAVEPSSQTLSVVCQDCGYKTEITGSPTGTLCPKCGGTRFNVELAVYSPDNVPEQVPVKAKSFSSTRRSLFSESEEDFQKTFSDTTDQFELTLKAFNGKTLTKGEFEKAFSNHMTAEEFEERGFGEVCDNGDVKISDTAFLQSRLFSKLIISVTKVLDLDPEITCPSCNKEHIIDELEQHGDLCPKGIIMIRKAHGLNPVGGCNHDEWLRDSGIMGDLKLEFGGLCKPTSDFQHTIEKRYPDAPMNILDLLKNKGIIKVNGGNIEILK